jgi:transposase InsO family protein
MKHLQIKGSMEKLSAVLGKTRQGYYKHQQVVHRREKIERMILDHVRDYRCRQPRVGTRKLHHYLLRKGVDIGRDRLFDLLRPRDLLVKPRRRYVRTTHSNHWYRTYRNLIKERTVQRPGEVVVGDITYLETREGFCYLSLLTDVYSRKIVGYHLSESLAVEGSLKALEMALKSIKNTNGLIHHSDRGVQYCCKAYTDRLTEAKARISMTEESHVYENAMAERVNGILKTEFLLGECLPCFSIAQKMVKEVIDIYNNERVHMSIDYMTPAEKFTAYEY